MKKTQRRTPMNKKKLLVVSVLMSASLFGCANPYAGNVYNSRQIGSVQTVKFGTVTSVRAVTLNDDTDMPVGAAAGAVAGGVLGYALGGGTGQKIATVGGVILGGLAGNAIQGAANQSNGLEIVVRTDNGQDLAVVQGETDGIAVGTRVQMIESGGRVKVSPVGG